MNFDINEDYRKVGKNSNKAKFTLALIRQLLISPQKFSFKNEN